MKDIWRSAGESIDCVDNLRASIQNYEGSLQKTYADSMTAGTEREAEINADAAAKLGCWNCNEQAELAFIYLRDKGVFPLDWVDKANDFLNFGGHSFVVIGRAKGKIKPAEWGESAVICDPHGAEDAFPASQIEQYMPRTKLVGKLRLDSRSESTIWVVF